MSNLITKTTELAMFITLEYVNAGDTVIDATCGTGHDTVSLAHAVGTNGKGDGGKVLQRCARTRMAETCLNSATCLCIRD